MPKPHSSGGKERFARITKAGNRYLRRLLYLDAMAQIAAPCARQRPSATGSCPPPWSRSAAS
jgi:transposase